jgi:hypothetical protein
MRFAIVLYAGAAFFSSLTGRALLGDESTAETPAAAASSDVPDIVYIDPVEYVPAPLRQPITITIDTMSLDAACQRISEQTGIRFMFDENSLADQGISIDEDVDGRASGEPLYLLLDRLFENVAGVQLDWMAAADGVVIASKDACDWQTSTRSYPIGDLVKDSSPEALIEIVRNMTGGPWEDSWEPMSDEDEQIAVLGNTLIVRESDRRHREIAMLLDALRKPGRERRVGEPGSHATLLGDLQQECTLKAPSTPLSSIVQKLNDDYGLRIWIDEQALSDQGISSDEELAAIAQNLTIGAALNRMLQNVAGVELQTIAQSGQLRVTTSEGADERPRTVVFDVSGVCGRSGAQIAALIVALKRVCRGNWRKDEAPVDVMLPMIGQGLIVARCDEAAALSIREFLAELRKQDSPAPVEEPATGNSPEPVIVYYRMEQETADRLVDLLPTIVAPGSWQTTVNSAGERTDLQSGGSGTIAAIQLDNPEDGEPGNQSIGSASEPSLESETGSESKSNPHNSKSVSVAFLIVRHSPDVQVEIKRHLELVIHAARRDPATDGWTFLPRVSKRVNWSGGFGGGHFSYNVWGNF